MTASRLLALTTALAFSFLSSPSAAAQGSFEEGVRLLREGNRQEALAAFQAVLASDPSNDEAYQLWQSTNHEVWLELLTEGGQFELVARDLMSRVNSARTEKRDDSGAIRALVASLSGDDHLARNKAIHGLRSDHGAFAVPQLLRALAGDNSDRRVIHMQALTQMGDDVVLPLIEACRSGDAKLRRNVALTLGYIGDPRANGMLAWMASSDPDGTVASAAGDALASCGGAGTSALEHLLHLGAAYHAGDASVLAPHQISGTVWHWRDGSLAKVQVPPALYGDELAKKAFYDALSASPQSTAALAGIARVCVGEKYKVDTLERYGESLGGLVDQVDSSLLAAAAVGSAGIEQGLRDAVADHDTAGAIGLCRLLAATGQASSQGLEAALGAGDPLRTEAALALGAIALRSGRAASGRVVATLGHAAGRSVLRVAAIVDGDLVRSDAIAQALRENRVFVNQWTSGARALSNMRRLPGLDLLVVADTLPDLTTAQVLSEIKRDPRTRSIALAVAATDASAAEDLYGDAADAIVSTDDLSAALELVDGAAEGAERALAGELAARASELLHHLAAAGASNLDPILADLVSATASGDESVAVHALGALRFQGGAGEVDAIAALLTDGGQPEAVRMAAAQALASIFARDPRAGGASLEGLMALLSSDASAELRLATAAALGQLDLDPAMRQNLLESVRVDVGE